MTIRPATSDDLPALRALLTAQMVEHAIPVDDRRITAAISAVLADPALGRLTVAVLDDVVVGVAYLSWIFSIEHAGPSAWLDELYVAPAAREHGIGTVLLHAALDAARERGCVAVDLEVEETHSRVEALYRREGFRPHNRRRWVRHLSHPATAP